MALPAGEPTRRGLLGGGLLRQIEQAQRDLARAVSDPALRVLERTQRELQRAAYQPVAEVIERHQREMRALAMHPAWHQPVGLSPSVRTALDDYVRNLSDVLRGSEQPWLFRFQEVLRPITDGTLGLNRQIVDYASSLQPAFHLSRTYLAQLEPFLRELEHLQRRGAKGEQTLDESGLGFLVDLWHLGVVASFADVPPQVRNPVVTRRLLTYTRSSEFEEELRAPFERSRLLRRRWPIIRAVLGAHRGRQYALAVPVLMAQIEGIVADSMVFQGLVVRRGHKVFRRGPGGKPLLDKNGKPIEIKGLDPLVRQSRLQQHPLLADLATHIADVLAPDRNGVLHGANTSFGTAKQAVRCLLVVRGLAALFNELETGSIE